MEISKNDIHDFYRDKDNVIKYNEKCVNCKGKCKQSHKAIIQKCNYDLYNGVKKEVKDKKKKEEKVDW